MCWTAYRPPAPSTFPASSCTIRGNKFSFSNFHRGTCFPLIKIIGIDVIPTPIPARESLAIFADTAGFPIASFRIAGSSPSAAASAWTQPATGFNRWIYFKYNGTVWQEMDKSAVDVPN